MNGSRRRVVGVLLSGAALAAAMVGCRRDDGGEVATDSPAEVLAFAASSGEKVMAGRTFRAAIDSKGTPSPELTRMCGLRTTAEIGIDLDRKLAFYELEPGRGTDVVLTPDRLYVRSSALPGWRIDRGWLAVALDDRQNLASVLPALRTSFSFSANAFESSDTSSPLTALGAIKDTASEVVERGHEAVRGADTTHFDLTIDPAKAGIWTGGTTTTSPAGPPAADDLRTRRQRVLDLLTSQRTRGAAPVPDEVRAAFINGDPQPLIDFLQRSTGTTGKQDEHWWYDYLLAEDPDAVLRKAEAATGTTVAPLLRKTMDQLLDGSGLDVGTLFQNMTSVKASLWVDGDGYLRRLDERIDMGGEDAAQARPMLDVRIEFFDIGKPVDEGVPPDSDVRAAADLAPGNVPTQLSPCNWRLPTTTTTTR